MFKKKLLNYENKRRFIRWLKAFFLRKSVCPFCTKVFHRPRKHKTAKA